MYHFKIYLLMLCVCVYVRMFRFGVFDVEDRCFVTFPSDSLTVPLPNNTYQIYYTPVDVNSSKIVTPSRIDHCYLIIITCIYICYNE